MRGKGKTLAGQDETGQGLAVVVVVVIVRGCQWKGLDMQLWFTQISPLEQWLSFEHPTQPWRGVRTAMSPAWHLKWLKLLHQFVGKYLKIVAIKAKLHVLLIISYVSCKMILLWISKPLLGEILKYFIKPANGISIVILHTPWSWTTRWRIARIWFFNTSLPCLFTNKTTLTIGISGTFRSTSGNSIRFGNQSWLAVAYGVSSSVNCTSSAMTTRSGDTRVTRLFRIWTLNQMVKRKFEWTRISC